MRLSEKHTISACFAGIVVQSIVINFPPLLFITFEREFGISLGKISLLIAISFIAQFGMDLLASRFPRLFDSRAVAILGQALPATGFVLMAFLPYVMSPFAGLVISVIIAAFGSGIIEVVGNPIIDSCTVKNKHTVLSALHSFYCWGLVLTVALSTLFFQLLGTHNWRILACLWAIIPALSLRSPSLTAENSGFTKKRTLSKYSHWVCVISTT
jgi:MFS family permease